MARVATWGAGPFIVGILQSGVPVLHHNALYSPFYLNALGFADR